jgi:hypothetical protein
MGQTAAKVHILTLNPMWFGVFSTFDVCANESVEPIIKTTIPASAGIIDESN